MNEEREVPQDESQSILADILFGGAIKRDADLHLLLAEEAYALGDNDQARESFNRAHQELAYIATHQTSERLSEEENRVWLEVQKRLFIFKDGLICRRVYDPELERINERFSRRAYARVSVD